MPLYRVGLTGGDGFECLLDQNDPRVQVSTVGVKLRDDFLRQSISFRADGTGVLETYDGPMLLKPDGSYVMYNQTARVAPDGFTKIVESVAWLDDDHIAVGSSVFPEGGGGVTGYWSAFNIIAGVEVDEIEGTDFRVVQHDGAIYTNDGRVSWNGYALQSDRQSYTPVQDTFGNLWDREGGNYGIKVRDDSRGLSFSLGEHWTISILSPVGTRISCRFCIRQDWVLSKYSRSRWARSLRLKGSHTGGEILCRSPGRGG